MIHVVKRLCLYMVWILGNAEFLVDDILDVFLVLDLLDHE